MPYGFLETNCRRQLGKWRVNLAASTPISPIGMAFNGATKNYDTHAIIQRRVAHHLAYLMSKSIQNNSPQHILEIGCGTGFLTEHLLETQTIIPYYATDIAPSAVQYCLEKLKRFSYLSGFVMDGERLDFENTGCKNLPSHVDWIVSSLAFQWFHNLPGSLKNMWDKTQGLAFSTLVEGTFQEWIDLCDRHKIQNTTRSFYQEDDLLALCKSLNPGYFHFEICEETQTFKGPLEFLQSLKKIGAHTPRDHFFPPVRPSGINSPLSLLLNSHPMNKDFTITYKVAYCVLGR